MFNYVFSLILIFPIKCFQMPGSPYLQDFPFPSRVVLDSLHALLTRVTIPFQSIPRFMVSLTYRSFHFLDSCLPLQDCPFPTSVILDSLLSFLTMFPFPRFLAPPSYNSLPEQSQILGSPYLEEYLFPRFQAPLLIRLPIPFQSGPRLQAALTQKSSHFLVSGSPYLQGFLFHSRVVQMFRTPLTQKSSHFLDSWLPPPFTTLLIPFQSDPRFLTYNKSFDFLNFWLPLLTKLLIHFQIGPRFWATLIRRVPISQVPGSPYKTSHYLPEWS